MICCSICYEPYDQSIHRPYSMSSCPHTFCLKCSEQFKENKCPKCGLRSEGKNLNMALLQVIPESEYDKLKAESLKAFIYLNEAKQDLKQSRLEKISIHETKLESRVINFYFIYICFFFIIHIYFYRLLNLKVKEIWKSDITKKH